jgi:hypothetical protein
MGVGVTRRPLRLAFGAREGTEVGVVRRPLRLVFQAREGQRWGGETAPPSHVWSEGGGGDTALRLAFGAREGGRW